MRTYREEFAVDPILDEVTVLVIAEASSWQHAKESTSFPEAVGIYHPSFNTNRQRM